MTGTGSTRRNLDVIPGTDSFVGVVPPEGQVVPPIATERQINVVLNWEEELTQRVTAR